MGSAAKRKFRCGSAWRTAAHAANSKRAPLFLPLKKYSTTLLMSRSISAVFLLSVCCACTFQELILNFGHNDCIWCRWLLQNSVYICRNWFACKNWVCVIMTSEDFDYSDVYASWDFEFGYLGEEYFVAYMILIMRIYCVYLLRFLIKGAYMNLRLHI